MVLPASVRVGDEGRFSPLVRALFAARLGRSVKAFFLVNVDIVGETPYFIALNAVVPVEAPARVPSLLRCDPGNSSHGLDGVAPSSLVRMVGDRVIKEGRATSFLCAETRIVSQVVTTSRSFGSAMENSGADRRATPDSGISGFFGDSRSAKI